MVASVVASVDNSDMGCEYLVRLDEQDGPTNVERLEEVLSRLPHYFGRVKYPNDDAFEFRTETRIEDTDSMPDLYVIARGGEINVCQNGDYLVTVQVLGAIVAEFVSEAKSEHIEVIKP